MDDKKVGEPRGQGTQYAVYWVAFGLAAQQRGAYRLAFGRQTVPELPPWSTAAG